MVVPIVTSSPTPAAWAHAGLDITPDVIKTHGLSDDEYKLNAVIDIIKAKCTKRGVSLKAFDYGAIVPALSGTVRQTAKIQSGIATEKAKEITKAVKDSKLKVQAQIQGEQVRVLSKSKDDLQATMTFLKGKDFGIDLQFTNYR